MKPEIMWCIANKDFGLYSFSNFTTRKGAIYAHCEQEMMTWEECKEQGDYAVKVKIEVVG